MVVSARSGRTRILSPMRALTSLAVGVVGGLAVALLGMPGVRESLRRQQHDARPLRQPRPHRRRPDQPLQLRTITGTQPQRGGSTIRHTASSHHPNRQSTNDARH